jgi:predicted N-acyltransferase
MLTELCPFARTSRCVEPTDTGKHYAFFPTMDAAAADWDAAAPADNVFLSCRYLSVLEACPPPGMRLGYVVFYQGNEPIGVALLQRANFEGRTHLRELTTSGTGWRQRLSLPFKRQLANCIEGQVVVCGNLLLTGEHGFYFKDGAIAFDEAMTLLLNALEDATRRWRPAAVLLKDVSPERDGPKTLLLQAEYTPFRIQPNMVLPLSFRSFDEYLAAMNTKYRTRAKRAFKKAAPLERRQLSLREVQQAQAHLHALYTSVARRSGFHWVDLHEDYLLALQYHLRDTFHCIGWYRERQLVGFHTALENGATLEAHFLGYEEAVNAEYQLYLNMLYDLVRLGIERGCERVVFGRTALEIKSSVGAQPEESHLYLRMQHRFVRRVSAPLLRYLIPQEHWVQRHPFKQGYLENERELPEQASLTLESE